MHEVEALVANHAGRSREAVPEGETGFFERVVGMLPAR
jgi:hypothetical protein